eukprot:TRINITY_DN28190_c0_g1_i16.p1 TRINITY_DN28190_c0_g1~~TRINITY_DN28190_c0_g1_i16.p1  ORF type:complete len:300 (-),score=70.55 TRINITY_DN28190_c0_g1_i16:139-1038(-)
MRWMGYAWSCRSLSCEFMQPTRSLSENRSLNSPIEDMTMDMKMPTTLLALQGGCNFRDLGGYQADDGRRVRPGVLYRSGVMAYMTPADALVLSELGIRAICDLRRADERELEPTTWTKTATLLSWDEEIDASMTQHLQPSDARRAGRVSMLSLYSEMPTMLRSRFKGVFERLVAGDVPLVFHCAAGKDRTGVAASLILSVLGVPRETIIRDYLITNEAVDLKAFMETHRGGLGLSKDTDTLSTMPEAILKEMMIADAEYLLASLASIETRHGSIPAYVHHELGVPLDAQARLRDALLES